MNPAGIGWGEPPQGGDEIGTHVGIGILLNDERSRRVAHEKQNQAITGADLFEEALDPGRDFEKALAARLNGESCCDDCRRGYAAANGEFGTH